MGCGKFLLFGLNFLVFIIGGAVVALASVVISNTKDYQEFLQDGVETLPVIVLIIGIIIGLIGFFGCLGALRENQCLLYTYALIVIILFVAQLTVGILVFVYQDEAQDTTKDIMSAAFNRYVSDDEPLKNSIDSLQSDLHCCGVNKYSDWFQITASEDVTIGCCKENADVANCYENVKTNQDEIYTQGCYDVLEKKVKDLSFSLGITAVILAIIQLACIMIACSLGKAAGRRSEYA